MLRGIYLDLNVLSKVKSLWNQLGTFGAAKSGFLITSLSTSNAFKLYK